MCTPQVIWVVDDDPSVRSGLSSLLRSLDYDVVTFESGMDLLAAVGGRHPRCIISDVQMPGMTGVDMYLRLIGAGIRIPTIFITAYPMPELQSLALDNGASAFLIKPVRARDLAAAVAVAVGPVA
ncbi:response regulator transcription factor [Paraburkholderia acidiphila]|uniref:Response regulator n=1 Tax=Paraburkholderia acidiphila TaxID=2571747 RepID=A0A7Z2GD30_9BURK|nr:response regulator [Paraburkholderia acidiphila]QGZ59522.1 response regulator [Paraburkholderia acidiphila]